MGAEGDRAILLLAGLGVAATKGLQLFADRAAAFLLLADLVVCNDPLHFPARGQLAVWVKAMASMVQILNGLLDGYTAARICPALRLSRAGDGSLFFHLVVVTVRLGAINAEFKVFADGAAVVAPLVTY